MAHRFHLQNRMFIFISFLPKKFFPPVSQFRLFSLFIPLLERLLNDKDASTFVLMFCSPFILHNNPNYSFDFINKTMKPTSIVCSFQIIWPIRGGSLDNVPSGADEWLRLLLRGLAAYPPPTQATPRIAGSRLSLVAAAENGRCGGATPTRSGELSDSTPATTKWTRTSPGRFP